MTILHTWRGGLHSQFRLVEGPNGPDYPVLEIATCRDAQEDDWRAIHSASGVNDSVLVELLRQKRIADDRALALRKLIAELRLLQEGSDPTEPE